MKQAGNTFLILTSEVMTLRLTQEFYRNEVGIERAPRGK